MTEPCRIPLRRRDGTVRAHALVDAEDYERLGHLRWCLCRGYVVRGVVREGGHKRLVKMHRDVLDLRHGDSEVDHINGDPLDNRKANLRLATRAENCQNLSTGWGASSHRGVSYAGWNSKRPWRAGAMLDRKHHHIGYFTTEREAADAAAAWRAEHMPFSREAMIA